MRIEISDLKSQLAGQWSIPASLYLPELEDTRKAARRHQACPYCGGIDRFRLFRDFDETGGGVCNKCGFFPDGIALFQHMKSWSFAETLKNLAESIGYKNTMHHNVFTKPKKPVQKIQQAPCLPEFATFIESEIASGSSQQEAAFHYGELIHDYQIALKNHYKIDVKASAILNTVISEAKPISSISSCNTVAQYLSNRGLAKVLDAPLNDLYSHPALGYFDVDANMKTCMPAMLGIVRLPNGQPISIHRTYLTLEGNKAKVTSPKKLMPSVLQGAVTGGAIQLFPATEALALTEGIETALAVYLMTGIPSWSAINANGLASCIIPKSVKKLFIYADKDLSKAGELAAITLAERYRHIEMQICMPPAPIPSNAKTIDWADIYCMESK